MTAWVRLAQPNFARTADMCALIVDSVTPSFAAMPLLDKPSQTKQKTRACCGVRDLKLSRKSLASSARGERCVSFGLVEIIVTIP